MSYDELELDMLGDRKTALFVIISDTDDTFNFVVSMMYTQLFNLLCDRADDVYDGQRSCTGSSRPAGIGRNQAALGAIYQPVARLCVSLQRPAERKNVIYQTRCQEPYGASGTFFVDFL